MKVSKLITIDVEIAEKLKQYPNSSGLINQLLKDHLQIMGGKTSVFEEKKAIFDDLKKKMAQIRKENKIISEFEALKLDKFALRWVLGQEKEPSFASIREYCRGRSLSIPSENFIKAFALVNKHGDLFKTQR